MLEPINSAFELENLLKERYGVGQHGKKARIIGPNSAPRMGSPTSFLSRERPHRQSSHISGAAAAATAGGTLLRQSSNEMAGLLYIGAGLKDASDSKDGAPEGAEGANGEEAAGQEFTLGGEHFTAPTAPGFVVKQEREIPVDAAVHATIQGAVNSQEDLEMHEVGAAENDSAQQAGDMQRQAVQQPAPAAVQSAGNNTSGATAIVTDFMQQASAPMATTQAPASNIMFPGAAFPELAHMEHLSGVGGLAPLPPSLNFPPSFPGAQVKQEDATIAAATAAAAAAAHAAGHGDSNMLDPSSLLAVAANGMQGLPPHLQGLPFPGLLPPGWGPILANPLAWQMAGRLPMQQQGGASNAAAAAQLGLFPAMQIHHPQSINEQLAALGLPPLHHPGHPGGPPGAAPGSNQEGGDGAKYNQGDRPGRPPSYDDMVRWCVGLKRCLWQRHVPLTIEEAVQMVNDPSLCVRPPALEGKSKVLVASTLRKRVLGIYRITWSQVASDSDPGLNEDITDPSVIAAAAIKLKRHGMDPVRSRGGGAAGGAAAGAGGAAGGAVPVGTVAGLASSGLPLAQVAPTQAATAAAAGGGGGPQVQEVLLGQNITNPLTHVPSTAGGAASTVPEGASGAAPAAAAGEAAAHGAAELASGPEVTIPVSSMIVNLPSRIQDLLDKGRSHFLSADEVCELLTSAPHIGMSVSNRPPDRPTAGSMYLFSRSASPRFRNDGYEWKRRESHAKLKIGEEAKLNCYYVGCSEDPVQRRCYWLIDDALSDLVLVHYQPSLAGKQGSGIPEGVYSLEGIPSGHGGAGDRAGGSDPTAQAAAAAAAAAAMAMQQYHQQEGLSGLPGVSSLPAALAAGLRNGMGLEIEVRELPPGSISAAPVPVASQQQQLQDQQQQQQQQLFNAMMQQPYQAMAIGGVSQESQLTTHTGSDRNINSNNNNYSQQQASQLPLGARGPSTGTATIGAATTTAPAPAGQSSDAGAPGGGTAKLPSLPPIDELEHAFPSHPSSPITAVPSLPVPALVVGGGSGGGNLNNVNNPPAQENNNIAGKLKLRERFATLDVNDSDGMFSAMCDLHHVAGISRQECAAVCRLWMENVFDEKQKKQLFM